MRKSIKKVLSGLLAALMVLTAVPFSAMAANYAVSEVIAKEDIPASGSLSPKLDVVWTAYTGNNKAFYLNGDSNWIQDGQTVTDLSTVSIEGQTTGADDCTLTANSQGYYFIAASFILRGTEGQFGNVEFWYNWDTSVLTSGRRMNATTGWNGTPALLATADLAMMDDNWEYYMTDNASNLESDNHYICYGTRLVNDEVPDATWQGDTSVLCDPNNPDPETAVVIDDIYIATVGFRCEEGVTISDDLLNFYAGDYGAIAFGNEGYKDHYYTMGESDNFGYSAGPFEIPMKSEVPPTPSHEHAYGTPVADYVAGAEYDENASYTHTATCTGEGDCDTPSVQSACTFTKTDETAATCDAAGSQTWTCDDCGGTYVVTLPATGHAYGDWATSVEGENGMHKRVCANDATHEEELACTFDDGEVTQNATYTQPEITKYTCTVCGNSYTKETAPALSHDHAYGTPVADYDSGAEFDAAKTYTHTATCTAEGDCNVPTKQADCAFTMTDETKATCDAAGSQTWTCDDCGGTYVVTFPATGHAYGDWATSVEGENGMHKRVCANDATHEEELACTFDDGEVVQNATVDQPEITKYTCTVCGNSYTKETAAALAGVTVTVNGTDMGAVTLDGETVAANGSSKKYEVNGSYTLTATPSAGCSFVGWSTNNKIVSADAEYTTVAVADVTYTPVFVNDNEALNFVFMDSFANVIDTQTVASGADVTIPTPPTYNGYTFTGWSATAEEIADSPSSMTVYAQYEKDANAVYTVNAQGATISYGDVFAADTLVDVPYGTQVTVTKEGATAWKIDNAVVAYGDSYTFYVASDVTLEAAEAVADKPVVAAVSESQVSGSYKVEFVATRSMTDGYTLLKAGFVYGKNLTDAELDLSNVGKTGAAADAGQVKAAYAASTAGDAQFILSYGISSQTGTACAKAFITYRDDATGAIQTIYSAPMTHTYGA